MPIYVYEVVVAEGDEPGQTFEVLQRMSDPPLTHHPETGQPVRRVMTTSNVAGRWTDSAMDGRVKDNKRLEQLGFTKYQKAGDGYYEKTAGKGPRVIRRGQGGE